MSSEHPTVNELIAYHEDRAGGETERIADHLVGCQECAALVLDLATFPDLDGGQAPDELEVRRAWSSLEPYVERDEPRPARPFAWQALAAVLALALVGVSVGLLRSRAAHRELVGRSVTDPGAAAPGAAALAEARAREAELAAEVERLEAEVGQLLEPQPGVPIVDLFPEGFLRGEPGDEAVVSGRPASFVVILNLQEPEAHPSYVVELIDPAGRTAWRREGLRPNEFGGLNLSLPARRLDGGAYRFRVLSPPGPDQTTVSAFAVTLAR